MLTKLLAGVVAISMSIAPVWAGEFGSSSEAVALVKTVQARFANDGPTATFAAITNQAPEFGTKDLYVFVYDLNGTLVAHGGDRALVGQNRHSIKDANGKLVVSEILNVVRQSGRGWVDYSWPNRVSVDDMSSYVERLGDKYIVGVPVFRSNDLRPVHARNEN
jgi:cytochrome c